MDETYYKPILRCEPWSEAAYPSPTGEWVSIKDQRGGVYALAPTGLHAIVITGLLNDWFNSVPGKDGAQ